MLPMTLLPGLADATALVPHKNGTAQKILPRLRAASGGEGAVPNEKRAVSWRALAYCPPCALRAARSASLRKVITATLLVRE